MKNSARFILSALILAAITATPSAQAQTYESLYSFVPITEGMIPTGGVARDSAGNMYGTTYNGDTGKALCGNPVGCGTVYKITSSGVGTVLYNFTGGTDGAFPNSGVIRDSAGNLYGTAVGGGTTGCGVVFKLNAAGTETVLYNFQCGDDGQAPGALIRDSAGNFYGTTQGGIFSGTVFKLDTSGVKTTLHSFTGPPDGTGPVGSLIRDSAGNLYGATQDGGTGQCGSIGCGIVYKLHSTGQETVLYSFTGSADGETPLGG